MLVGFSSLLHELVLLEGNIHDKDAPSNGELAMSGLKGMPIIPMFPLDPKLPWGILTKLQALTNDYIYQAWHTLPSPSP
jgi:hypothetical protein